MTLRARFALWVSVFMMLVLGGFCVFVYVTVSHWLWAGVDDSLRVSAAQLIATSDIDHGRLDVSADPVALNADLTQQLGSRGFSIQIFSRSGTSLQSFGPFDKRAIDPAALQTAVAGKSSLATSDDPRGAGEVRVHTEPVIAGGEVVAVVQVSQSLENLEALRRTLLTTLILGSPVVCAVAGLGGYLLVRRALVPIDQITRTARKISAEDLTRRLDLPQTRDEVGRLAATLDDMLTRLDRSFQRERQFAHDAAHELRTPLTAMQSILSVTAQRTRTPTEYEEALADLSDETNRLRALTDDLLVLARAEAPAEPADAVDLATLLPDVADSLRHAAEAKDLTLICEMEGDLRLIADSDSLIRVLVNLLDNAIKYTAQGAVTLAATGSPESVSIRISDTGEGIGPQHLPHVFKRFYRAEEARSTRGSGLGLAISAEIVRAHGGTLDVQSIQGDGSTFTLTLPRHPFPAA